MHPSKVAFNRAFRRGALAMTFVLAACGGGGEPAQNTSVAMKDLEVVDGTASDAMTDLDGVRTEGTATAPVTGDNASAAAPEAAENASAASAAPAEVVAEQ